MLDRLKWYMRPFYQDEDTILNSYLTEFGSAEKAASVLWIELPAIINSGAIKSYDTGASSTVFNDPEKVVKFCRERSNYFADRFRGNDGSVAILVERDSLVGGVSE